MGEDVRRTLDANKKKIQEAAKRNVNPEKAVKGSRFRNSPVGRRLEALRKRKLEGTNED